MYLIERTKELDEDTLRNFLIKFQGVDLPHYSALWDYYNGKQKILSKTSKDPTKVYNKVVVNYCYNIVQNYLGYLTGIPISYDNDEHTVDDIIDILKWNDYINEDAELLKQGLIYGRAFELTYTDELGKQRFRMLDTRDCIPVYDNSINNELLYVIRFWEEELDANNQPIYLVEVYSSTSVKRYRSNAGFLSFWFLEEVPHFYKQCPITVFSLNKEERGVFEQILTLQDAYNEVLSGSIDDFDAFADAYMVLTNCQADDDDLTAMKEKRVLELGEGADASYLTKQLSDTQVSNLLTNFKDNIHKIANSPDFTDEKFMAQSGTAIRYKLVGFENASSSIESYLRKALTKRIELLSAVLSLTDSERVWRDINITFTRNLPTDLTDTVTIVNQLKGLVSDRTLLTLLPFISDVDKELEQVKEEKAESVITYGVINETEEEDTEDTDK